MRLPFNYHDCQYIGNFVNHGGKPPTTPDGYLRTGKYCVTGDKDESKCTYWRGDWAHDGTDFTLPIGSPIFAIENGFITDASESSSAGLNIGLRSDDLPGNRTYYRYLHLSEMRVKSGGYVREGELIALSGDSGICGEPHLHLSIGTSSGGGQIDPLINKRYKFMLQGLPHVPRENTTLKHFHPFSYNSPTLVINGKSQSTGWNGEESIYEFACDEPILEILHTVKFIDGWWREVEDYDLLKQAEDIERVSPGLVRLTITHDAKPGLYYFQGLTGKGHTFPVRILLRDRIIL